VVPSIPGLVVIPSHIGFLDQFFSVQVFVANVAPQGSNLSVHSLEAEIVLPPGKNPERPPLAFARVGPNQTTQSRVALATPGSDGVPLMKTCSQAAVELFETPISPSSPLLSRTTGQRAKRPSGDPDVRTRCRTRSSAISSEREHHPLIRGRDRPTFLCAVKAPNGFAGSKPTGRHGVLSHAAHGPRFSGPLLGPLVHRVRSSEP
jgi:hypothetical protein